MQMEVSLITLHDGETTIYKVTKRIPELQVSETWIFHTYEEALLQFKEWSDSLL